MVCAEAGLGGVEMRFVVFEYQWMNVAVSEPDSTYAEGTSFSTQRRKVLCVLWRCPHGHRHQEVYTAPLSLNK